MVPPGGKKEDLSNSDVFNVMSDSVAYNVNIEGAKAVSW
jgi:hypothetical protein